MSLGHLAVLCQTVVELLAGLRDLLLYQAETLIGFVKNGNGNKGVFERR